MGVDCFMESLMRLTMTLLIFSVLYTPVALACGNVMEGNERVAEPSPERQEHETEIVIDAAGEQPTVDAAKDIPAEVPEEIVATVTVESAPLEPPEASAAMGMGLSMAAGGVFAGLGVLGVRDQRRREAWEVAQL